jgi:hypothetical protein
MRMLEDHQETNNNYSAIHPEGLLLEQEVELERQYRISLWWVRNKSKLKYVGVVIFVLFDAILMLFAAWLFVDAYLINYEAEQQAVAQMVVSGQADLNAYTKATAAEDLDFEKTKVFSTGDGAYDFYAIVINPNTDWWAEYTYQFTHTQGETQILSGFILPNEEKPLVALGIDSGVVLTSASLAIENIVWHRVDHHVTGEYQEWLEKRLQLNVYDPVYVQTLEAEEDVEFGRVTFTVKNEGTFSYYDPKFYLVLMRNNTPVGINITTLQSLESGGERDIAVNWFGVRPSATSVEIIPEINLFDLDAYKPLEGELPDDLRTRVFSE